MTAMTYTGTLSNRHDLKIEHVDEEEDSAVVVTRPGLVEVEETQGDVPGPAVGQLRTGRVGSDGDQHFAAKESEGRHASQCDTGHEDGLRQVEAEFCDASVSALAGEAVASCQQVIARLTPRGRQTASPGGGPEATLTGGGAAS